MSHWPTFHFSSARTHANVDKRISLLADDPKSLISQDPFSCWFCSIHSTHWGKHGVWEEPCKGTIATHAVSYGDGGNSTLWRCFLILASRSFRCTSSRLAVSATNIFSTYAQRGVPARIRFRCNGGGRCRPPERNRTRRASEGGILEAHSPTLAQVSRRRRFERNLAANRGAATGTGRTVRGPGCRQGAGRTEEHPAFDMGAGGI